MFEVGWIIFSLEFKTFYEPKEGAKGKCGVSQSNSDMGAVAVRREKAASTLTLARWRAGAVRKLPTSRWTMTHFFQRGGYFFVF